MKKYVGITLAIVIAFVVVGRLPVHIPELSDTEASLADCQEEF